MLCYSLTSINLPDSITFFIVLLFLLDGLTVYFVLWRFPKRRAEQPMTSARMRWPSWRRWLTLCSSAPFASSPSRSARSLKPCSGASASTRRASRGWEHTLAYRLLKQYPDSQLIRSVLLLSAPTGHPGASGSPLTQSPELHGLPADVVHPVHLRPGSACHRCRHG